MAEAESFVMLRAREWVRLPSMWRESICVCASGQRTSCQRWQYSIMPGSDGSSKRACDDQARNKEESKAQEGDPHIKARIRSIMREMARKRMMQDVRKPRWR